MELELSTAPLKTILEKYTDSWTQSTLSRSAIFFCRLPNGIEFHIYLSPNGQILMRARLLEEVSSDDWMNGIATFRLIKAQSRVPACLEYTEDKELHCFTAFDLTASEHPATLCAVLALSFIEFLNLYHDFSFVPCMSEPTP